MRSDNIKHPIPSEIAGWIKFVLDQIEDVKTRNEAMFDMAQRGTARQGVAGPGLAGQGKAQRGMVGQSMDRRGPAQQGEAGHGMARSGAVKQGEAREKRE